jgi:hypothetical protein
MLIFANNIAFNLIKEFILNFLNIYSSLKLRNHEYIEKNKKTVISK